MMWMRFALFLALAKKRLNKPKQPLAGHGEDERAPMKKGRVQILLKLGNLHTHSRLLDTIGNVSHRVSDPLVFGYKIKKLEMVNIHDRVNPTAGCHLAKRRATAAVTLRVVNRQTAGSNWRKLNSFYTAYVYRN